MDTALRIRYTFVVVPPHQVAQLKYVVIEVVESISAGIFLEDDDALPHSNQMETDLLLGVLSQVKNLFKFAHC